MGFAPLMKLEPYKNVDLSKKVIHCYGALDYGEEHSNIEGVPELMEQIKAYETDYQLALAMLCAEWQPKLDAAHEEVVAYAKKKRFFKVKLVAILIAALFALLTILSAISALSVAQTGQMMSDITPFYIGIIVAILVYIYLKYKTEKEFNSMNSNFSKQRSQAEEAVNQLNGAYRAKDSAIKEEIDSLYLATLDPAQREIVFMRRDQERQHKEMMRAQERSAQLQREHQNRMEKEQEQIKRDQRRLLEIEEERERRRR